MKHTAICFSAVVACLVTLTLALPVAAQGTGDEVFPGIPKLVYPHDADLGPVPITDLIPWFWHPGQDYTNVAGVQFVLKYDPYEVNILGIDTFVPGSGPFDGHSRFDPPPPLLPSQGQPVPNGALPAALTGTVWINHDQANNSGITLPVSQGVQLFDLYIQPRHTSQVSLNSDVDIRVSELRPIYHVTGSTHLQSSWRPRHIDDPGGEAVTVHLPGSIIETQIVPQSASVWSHVTSVLTPGKVIPHSATYFRGPLVSTLSAPTPLHASGVIGSSVLVHGGETSAEITTVGGIRLHWGTGPGDIPPSAFAHLPGTVTSLSILINPSSFYVGDPVGDGTGDGHFGLGIDHVPEPSALVLLVLGGLAAAMQRWTRRRRRRTT